MDNQKNSFYPAQQEAIRHQDGPMLVLAGPGSGKTLVITYRTRQLIEKYGISPSEILVITFTRAAAGEMKERFQRLMGERRLPVTFGTFHAVFYHILKYAYRLTSANILAEDVKYQILREIIAPMQLEIDDETEFLTGIANEISIIKNDQIELEHYYAVNCPEESFREIYRKYQAALQQKRLWDFDDMLVSCYHLFKERPDILRGWQKRYRYILIDEFQDVNRIQYEVIRMLAKPENNLFIVGDDDQSIYRFRGAKPEIMLNFPKDFPETKTVILDKNFRCPKAVMDAAGNLISYNQDRFEKRITALKRIQTPVEIREFANQAEENAYIISQIQEFHNSGRDYKDIAVLFRTNTGPRLLLEKFMEYSIPFQIKDRIPSIYDHWIAKNMISYINLALEDRSRSEFLQVMNRPKRYISREAVQHNMVTFGDLQYYYQDKQWMVERLQKFEEDLHFLAEMGPYAAVHYIRHGIGYEEFLHEYAQYRRMKPEDLIEVLDEIQESAKACKTYQEWFVHIEDYTRQLKEKSRDKSGDGVTFATLHGSKGLEFENVYLIDVNEGVMPHKKAVLDADIQEERRMFYVGMTRSKELLHIFSVKEQFNKEMSVSRFVGELHIGKEQLKPGINVMHKEYGRGQVETEGEGKIKVYFPDKNKKVLLNVEYCVTNRLLCICGENEDQT